MKAGVGQVVTLTVLKTVDAELVVAVMVAVARVKTVEVAVPETGVEVLNRVSERSYTSASQKNTYLDTVVRTVAVWVAVTSSWVKVKSGPKNPARLANLWPGTAEA